MGKKHETRFQSMEEKRKDALEVAQEEDEEEKARPEDEKEITSYGQWIALKGVWGNLES